MQKTNRRRYTRKPRMQFLVSHFEEEAEQERRKIARQLHDDIGQNLALLVFLLDQLKRSPGTQSSEALAQAQEIAAELIARVREISLEVRPAIPERIGLLPTLEAALQELEAKTGVQPRFTHSGLDKPLPNHIATAAYLITHKAAHHLGNGGSRLEIGIRATGKSLGISITASGAEGNQAPASDDMQWIRDRAEYLGGTFNLSATDGAATRMTVRLPISTLADETPRG